MNGSHHTLTRMVVERHTGRFLKKNGGWTLVESEAAVFDDLPASMENCQRLRLNNAEALLRFNHSNLEWNPNERLLAENA
jgi:hypothetical protein